MPSRRETIGYLYGLQSHGIKPGLTRIRKLLSALGNPERAYPTIHVAGTNGKGSTSAMVYSVLCKAGYNTGLYTSPHLIKFNERIRTARGLISDASIVRTAGKVRHAAESAGMEGLTFFEFTTAMAFLYFRDKGVEAAVIETGMGGRWDATNTVAPLVSVITNIGLDHRDYLGETIGEIASEKAGIIKKGIPVITAEEKRTALKPIREAALKKGAPLLRLGHDFCLSKKGRGLVYEGRGTTVTGLCLGLQGPHQVKNAACALAAIEALRVKGFVIPLKAVREGLKGAEWPGRVEVVSRRPLVILDSAHNSDGARALRAALGAFRYRALTLVAGIMGDKDIDGILRELLPISGTVVLTAPKTERAASPRLLEKKTASFRGNVIVKDTVKEAVRHALQTLRPGGALCVTGSIFTVGEAKKVLPRLIGKKS